MKNSRISLKIYPVQLVISIMLFLLPFCFYLEKNTQIGLVAYYDEVLCIITIVYIAFEIMKQRIKKMEWIFIILTLLIVIIGASSNVLSHLVTKPMPIIVDIIALLKINFTFIAFRIIGSKDKSRVIFSYLTVPAKLLIISAFFFAVLNMFMDIGMSDSVRYGMKSYYFIFKNEGRLGIITACCLLIVIYSLKDLKRIIAYIALSFFTMICTTKGTVYVIMIIYIVLFLLWKYTKRNRLDITQALLTTVAVVLGSRYQINMYYKDDRTPRVRLIKYGIVTANDYFPFGSGFATYGSDQAAKNYSPLYIKYGFNQLYGLSQTNGSYLNDCYLGMLFGQFGYIGTVLFFITMVMIFFGINNVDCKNRRIKALTLSIFVCLVFTTIGSAIIKSSIGVFGMAIIGISTGYMEAFNQNENRLTSDEKVNI